MTITQCSSVPKSNKKTCSEILESDRFLQVLRVERKRTERSGIPFLLLRVDLNEQYSKFASDDILVCTVMAMSKLARDTDTVGWYREHITASAIYTGISPSLKDCAIASIKKRITSLLTAEIHDFDPQTLRIVFDIFPTEQVDTNRDDVPEIIMYPDSSHITPNRSVQTVAKRVIDICGSLVLLSIFAPIMVLIAALVKLTSRGPIFFKQNRVGHHGRQFTFLKFRSMYANNDPSIHQQYIADLITAKRTMTPSEGSRRQIYKLSTDNRVTLIGRILRRTSIDELPQLFNVLRGEMSLVGPRPPIPYEIEAYDPWHRSRYLLVQPGITGLWQVTARSRVSFDEMVRLDIQYATTWTLWLDIKLLLQTPGALFRGAY